MSNNKIIDSQILNVDFEQNKCRIMYTIYTIKLYTKI